MNIYFTRASYALDWSSQMQSEYQIEKKRFFIQIHSHKFQLIFYPYFCFCPSREPGPGDVQPISHSVTLEKGLSHQITLIVDPPMIDVARSVLSILKGINLDQVLLNYFIIQLEIQSKSGFI